MLGCIRTRLLKKITFFGHTKSDSDVISIILGHPNLGSATPGLYLKFKHMYEIWWNVGPL